MNNFVDKRVLCPYYRKSDSKLIVCEGLEENEPKRMPFSSNSEKKEYMDENCTKCWRKCFWADELNRKWDDNE